MISHVDEVYPWYHAMKMVPYLCHLHTHNPLKKKVINYPCGTEHTFPNQTELAISEKQIFKPQTFLELFVTAATTVD